MAVHVVDHPLIAHKLTIIRDKQTSMRKFREIVSEITLLLTYEATRDMPLTRRTIETPLARMSAPVLEDEAGPLIVPILRSGLGMVHSMLELFPLARVAHLGMKRDEHTAVASTYYMNLPSQVIEGATVIVLDPMLATAGTMCDALALLKAGKPKALKAICLIGAPEGKARVERDHPDVPVYLAALDERLNEKAYIVPGLGDAGDRMFGTSV